MSTAYRSSCFPRPWTLPKRKVLLGEDDDDINIRITDISNGE